MKKFLSLLLAAAMLGLSACSSPTEPETSSDNSAAPSAEAATTAPEFVSTGDVEADMITRSLMTMGDTSRLLNVLAKAERGEEITVGYIGGSITEGLTAGAELCWAKLSYNWLCEQYPNTKINYVNAGMSGTPSVIGVLRAERDLFTEHTPDLVFVEFAVNDGQDAIYRECYESLVAKILQKENNPAVCLFFTVLKSGYTCEEHMSEIGNNYSLPMVSLNNVLSVEFESGRMVWEDYSDDESHPNVAGHEMVAKLIENVIIKAQEELAKTAELPAPNAMNPTPVYTTDYAGAKLLDSATLTADSLGDFVLTPNILSQFPNSWENKTGTEGISFAIDCKTLFVIFRCNDNARFGAVNVYVDGEFLMRVDSNRSSGWNSPEAQLLFNNDSCATHKIDLVPDTEGTSTYFGLLGFGYTT